jgi:acyl-CoA synthetase (AMP-forming)/AMP-acid ligase II
MPSELDRRLAAAMQRLTARGAAFETGLVEARGLHLPAFTRAPATLPALFDHFCARHGEAEFLVDGDLRLSFAEVHALALRAAAGLALRYGVGPGDRVGIAARNSASWVIAYMGVLIAGGCATLLNGWWAGPELAGGIALADCKLVLADPERLSRLEGQPVDTRLVGIHGGAPETGLSALLTPSDMPWRPPDISGGDPAALVFTSGSTGIAKAALSDHRAVVQASFAFAAQSLSLFAAHTQTQAQAQAHAQADSPIESQTAPVAVPVMVPIMVPVPPHQTTLLGVPLFHVTGMIALLLPSFVLGRRVVIMSRWDAREALRLIERERVTVFAGVPLMSLEIATHPARAEHDLSSCGGFAAGGAPRPLDHVDRLREALPDVAHLLGYGLTETNCLGSCNMGDNYLAKPASSGPASQPLVEIAVIGPDGAALPTGLHGEIAVRSICNFTGYWRNPEETAATLRPDGFFLTGDLGYLDADGYLFVVDRRKDIIIRGGENIASAEVEQAIYAHPGIAEASVFGLPHARYGEVPVAVYAIRDGHRLSEDDLRAHLATRIAAFKVPVRLWREENGLPRLGAQKIDKRTLKARYSQAWEAAKGAL